jgi:hypothetical protein
VHFTRVRADENGPAAQILDHGAVEANLPSSGWSAVVMGREFSPHGPDAVPAVDDMFVEIRSLVCL